MEVIFRGSCCYDDVVVLELRVSGCWRYRDAESVKNWILKEIYTVKITAKHWSEIEFLQARGLEGSLIKII